LDSQGIDVVGGDTANVRLGNRPRVAKLVGMPTSKVRTEWNSAPWMKDFLSGATGFVGAIRTDGEGRTAKSTENFLAEWRAAIPEKRVFLSFTSADVEFAHATASALRARGYVTFVFLGPGDLGPKYDPEFVGKMFADAHHWLVLDTPNARRSRGVWLEASVAKGMGGSPPSPDPPSRGSGGKGPRDEPPGRSSGGEPSGETFSKMDEAAFMRDVKSGVVTRNPSTPGKLFVHRELRGGALVDATYLMKVEADGSWSVYRPQPTGAGLSYGEHLGRVKRPPKVNIGLCSCR
jgi:hypothetical protein